MAASQEAGDRISGAPAAFDPEEVEKFDALAEDWWDPAGPMAPLHRQGPARLTFLREALLPLSKKGPSSLVPLSGLQVLDLGCGAGLVSEPLSRLGAKVTAIDASEHAIAAAKAHAIESGLKIDYRNCSAETLLEEGKRFDAVVSLEVIEHVPDPGAFVDMIAALVRPDGVVALSTLNRTAKSFALAIVGAEYVLRWLPRGTHSWRRFLKPSEVGRMLRHSGLSVTAAKGIVYNPLDQGWRLSQRDLDVNYILAARKER
ncbi:MAG: bifunctional 2-polyprenyl-6-hydroxyphenol methylase/3-demethylubiquinol 3-O-methyltransferase UbiG [Kiloniellales bacterium]